MKQENIKYKMKEINIGKYIKNFNKDFNVNVNIKNTQFLHDIFFNFIDINMTGTSTKDSLDEIVNLEEQIIKKLGKDDNLFKKWNDLHDNYMLDIIEQAFIYGICTHYQFNEEIKNLCENEIKT